MGKSVVLEEMLTMRPPCPSRLAASWLAVIAPLILTANTRVHERFGDIGKRSAFGDGSVVNEDVELIKEPIDLDKHGSYVVRIAHIGFQGNGFASLLDQFSRPRLLPQSGCAHS